MTNEWVVLIEAERDESGGVLTIGHLDRLLELLREHAPAGLWSADRYAIQLLVPSTGPDGALASALAWWQRAADRLGLPQWRLVRVEIKTPAELEAEHRAAAEDDRGPSGPCSEEALRAAYLATRRLLAARSRGEAADVLVRLAAHLGATLVSGEDSHPHALPVDLSCGADRPLQPAVEPMSMARLDLEEVLPALMVDAARVLRLLDGAAMGTGAGAAGASEAGAGAGAELAGAAGGAPVPSASPALRRPDLGLTVDERWAPRV
ncbi:MAG: hypothetical protein ABR511_07115 [Acidimicrobiales bacterium]